MTQSARPAGRLVLPALVLLLVVAVLAVVLLWPSPKHRAAAPPPPSPTASPSPSPSLSPTKQLPYPWFPVGACLDHPKLSPVITVARPQQCDGQHDAESIGNPLLPDGLLKESQIALTLERLCQPYAAAAEAKQGGGTWFSLPTGPSLKYYSQGYRDASCLLAASDREGGTKLTAPLKG
ncbi:hypothetical protein P3T35_006652 [Kitasatospora sp. GP30]|uniref:hypothetical protein n=1 Tax=Kitasatospora sp. GP30 TaxID=3035084 RepID=UPI000C70BA80|nr:hypothetical protein [Kitasatospora sp. GP30]MDH6144609.1 hypothetical protein [Kitasatospora sp. GP30]